MKKGKKTGCAHSENVFLHALKHTVLEITREVKKKNENNVYNK